MKFYSLTALGMIAALFVALIGYEWIARDKLIFGKIPTIACTAALGLIIFRWQRRSYRIRERRELYFHPCRRCGRDLAPHSYPCRKCGAS